MGALQILMRSNPLAVPGLTLRQSLLFFESCTYPFLAITMVITSLVPIPFLFVGVSPLQCNSLWVSGVWAGFLGAGNPGVQVGWVEWRFAGVFGRSSRLHWGI